MSYTLVHDANEVVVGPKGEESSSADGPGRNEDTDGGLLATETEAAVVIEDGTVHAVGDSGTLRREYPAENAAVAVDADGRCVLPGFVDAHTHALFAGDRSDEFAAKLQGVPYQEILAEGGGILRTVRAVREASEDHLVERFTEALNLACRHGTTTFEVKSGYGLSVESELKMLTAIERAAADHPVDVVPTFMGAHAVPEGRDADAYTEDVIDEQLPAVESRALQRSVTSSVRRTSSRSNSRESCWRRVESTVSPRRSTPRSSSGSAVRNWARSCRRRAPTTCCTRRTRTPERCSMRTSRQ